ncbi:Bug family tripartite tricarboxylate transporter substrate binding protein [Piscinibacter koreensis]|uniref:Tripartite tricarboxylate transporter substrate binding protein n=1 Tax=Piscinibacter koreensis TaxID=2742824 RepID=A0A7Y6NMX5_9BURK|nr:tripartite tricarboxylate transporter substrate binding protein [Schlegelella koreensis]NUZ06084.1 tripartite tricarboxylate transporter substrate binding protein [Schlegelella koreensis]
MRRVLSLLLAGAAATFLGTAASQAEAQSWPSRPVRVIVPFAPGGGIDILTRAIANELTTRWKQPIVIDNRGGAGSLIGTEAVAKAPPDGYTLLATVNQSMVANRFLYKSLPYDPDKNFEPIMMMVISDQLLIANANLPANNLKEVIALAKRDPGKLNYGSFGIGSQPHLLYETINVREGTDLLHVPYKGITPNLQALASGEVMLGTGSAAVAAPLIAAGRIKPISVAGSRRVAQFPKVPTTAEEGYPYVRTSIWYALFAPAGTPAEVTNRIRNDVRAILTDPAFAEANAVSKGLTVVAGDRDQLVRTIREESASVAEQVKAAKVTPE